jgi:Bacterial regulatory proteins, gntR family
VATLLSGDLGSSLLDALTILFFIGVVALYDLSLTLISVGFAAINISVVLLVRRMRTDLSIRLQQEQAKLFGTSVAGLQLVETLLTDAIAGGAIEPGERLVETEIAARMGVSRVPLREALSLLEAQGIVEALPNRGARVVPFDDARVDRACEARVALERLALRTAVPVFRLIRRVLRRSTA